MRKHRARANRDKHEAPFALQLLAAKMPTPEREYRFAAVEVGWILDGEYKPGAGKKKPALRERLDKAGLKDWRFDFAWPALRLAVEVEGAPGRGRHTTAKGFIEDIHKYNAAALLGWTVLRCTGDMVRNGQALAMLEKYLDVYA